MPTPAASQFTTVSAAAEALAVSPKTIRKMIAAGDLHAVRLGKRMIRVSVDSLAALGRPLTVQHARGGNTP